MYRPIIFAWNSGAEKDTLALWLSKQDPDFIVSKARVTTRNPRNNETEITFVDATTFNLREKAGRIISAYGGDTLEIQQRY